MEAVCCAGSWWLIVARIESAAAWCLPVFMVYASVVNIRLQWGQAIARSWSEPKALAELIHPFEWHSVLSSIILHVLEPFYHSSSGTCRVIIRISSIHIRSHAFLLFALFK